MLFLTFADAELLRITEDNIRRKVECFISPFYDKKLRRAAFHGGMFNMKKMKNIIDT